MRTVVVNFLIAVIVAVAATETGFAASVKDTADSCYPKLNSMIIQQDIDLPVRAYVPTQVELKTQTFPREYRWWWTRLKQWDLNLQDTSVIYPKFIGFCVDVYNWGDRFFNGMDKDYVIGTGKRWKARVVNEYWCDGYGMTLPRNFNIAMLSHLYGNIGAYLQYMAVSVGYSYDMSTVFGSDPLEHKKFEFGFNCQRFNVELYRWANNGGSNIRKFGKYFKGKTLDVPFKGVDMMVQGIDFIYFLNNKKYSHGAAYNFSKIQKRSQGSPIVGLSYTDVNLDMDFSRLPVSLLPKFPIAALKYRIHYDSYAIVGGYGFNWVITPKLLFNVTATPSIGFSHCFPDNLEGEKWMISLNMGGRTSLTYNFGNWFICGMGRYTGHWYRSGNFSLLANIMNFSVNVGIRF